MILSIFLGGFGVDRFYIGHTGLGIGKLLVTLLLPIVTLGISLFFSWIWIVVDWFLIMDATRQANAQKLYSLIG